MSKTNSLMAGAALVAITFLSAGVAIANELTLVCKGTNSAYGDGWTILSSQIADTDRDEWTLRLDRDRNEISFPLTHIGRVSASLKTTDESYSGVAPVNMNMLGAYIGSASVSVNRFTGSAIAMYLKADGSGWLGFKGYCFPAKSRF